MRSGQFRLRTVMITIALLALVCTVIMQRIQLQRSQVTAELYRAEAERARVFAEQARQKVEAELIGIPEDQNEGADQFEK
jgi:uncharacterized membrane protein